MQRIGWFTCVIVNCTMKQHQQEHGKREFIMICVKWIQYAKRAHHNNKPTNKQTNKRTKAKSTLKMSLRMRFFTVWMMQSICSIRWSKCECDSIFGVNGCITVIHCPLPPIWSIHTKQCIHCIHRCHKNTHRNAGIHTRIHSILRLLFRCFFLFLKRENDLCAYSYNDHMINVFNEKLKCALNGIYGWNYTIDQNEHKNAPTSELDSRMRRVNRKRVEWKCEKWCFRSVPFLGGATDFKFIA